MSQLKSSTHLRVALIYNPAEKPNIASKIAKAAFDSQTSNLGIRNLLGKLLKEETLKNLKNGKSKVHVLKMRATKIVLTYCEKKMF